MSIKYGVNQYKQTSVTTASRGQVLLMLYEGCMKYCRLAIEATKAKNLHDKGVYILKVQDIINELSVTLNHDIGGDISKELERLYNYMVDLLTQANIKNDHRPLETILKLLDTLYQGWKVAINQTEKGAAPPNPGATVTATAAAPAAAAAEKTAPAPAPANLNAQKLK